MNAPASQQTGSTRRAMPSLGQVPQAKPKSPQARGRASRCKGARGELEAAALLTSYTGQPVTRLVRRHGGDADLIGVDHWAIEVKRMAKASEADLRRWWDQAARQAEGVGRLPLLMVRVDRSDWKCWWPAAAWNADLRRVLGDSAGWQFDNTLAAAPDVWAHYAMEPNTD